MPKDTLDRIILLDRMNRMISLDRMNRMNWVLPHNYWFSYSKFNFQREDHSLPELRPNSMFRIWINSVRWGDGSNRHQVQLSYAKFSIKSFPVFVLYFLRYFLRFCIEYAAHSLKRPMWNTPVWNENSYYMSHTPYYMVHMVRLIWVIFMNFLKVT